MKRTAVHRVSLLALISGVACASPLPVGPLPPAGSTLSLSAALALALNQSPAVRVQESFVEQKSGLLQQASGAFDWNGWGGVSLSRDAQPVPFADLVNRSTSTAYTLGAGKLFRDGIYVTPTLNVGVNANAPARAIGGSQVSLQIVIPLLRGLGADSTGATEAAARGDVEVARLLYRHALATVAYATAATYWSSRAADDAFQVQRDVEQSAERLVASTKVLVDTRVFPPAYLIQAEANLRDKRSVRIDAELQARNARFGFGRALGLDPEQMAVTPAATDAFPRIGPETAAVTPAVSTPLIRRALTARADYLATQQSLVPLNLFSRKAELDLKPQVNLTFTGGYRGLNEGNDPFAPIGDRVAGPNGQIGLSFAWPYNNTYQKGLVRDRRSQVRMVEAQLHDLSLSIANDVLVALEQVRLRADGVRSAQETVDLSKRAIAAQYEQLRAGEGTILDIISLENISAGARIRYINAHAAYATAVAQLRYSLGAIFTPGERAESPFTLNDLTSLPAP